MDRVNFDTKLRSILPPEYTLYFQPPTNTVLKPPYVLYKRLDVAQRMASNVKYISKEKYQITVVDSDPDSVLASILTMHPDAHFQQEYPQNNLYHHVFNMT